MRNLFLGVAYLFSLATVAQPILDCGLSMTVDNILFSWNGSSLVYTANLSLTRSNNSNQCKNIRIGFSTGISGNYDRTMVSGGNTVSYNLYADNSTNTPLKSLADASGNSERLTVKFQNNELQKTVSFEGRLPVPNQGRLVLPKGNYSDIITATASPKGSNSLSADKNFQVSLNLPAEIDVSLVNSGGAFDPSKTNHTMDFNIITLGDSRQVDLKVKSNAGYTLSLSSQNGGSLKHLTSANFSIGYLLKVNGVGQSFSGAGIPLVIGTGVGITPTAGVNFTLNIEIGDPSNKLAGTYQDVITVTATSND